MKPHQERVIQEKSELDTKIEKLSIFIESNLKQQVVSAYEHSMLEIQLSAMKTYSTILAERIAQFGA